MSEFPQDSADPDFSRGVAFADLAAAGKLAGRVGEENVLLMLSGEKIFAVGAHCTHYHAPLIDGLAEGGVLRCPWHHAVFDLATGEALNAPAFAPLSCWEVEREGNKVFVRKRRESIARSSKIEFSDTSPKNIVIVGGGAAGFAAAERLRREGYGGKIVMVSDDPDPPTDRPNLSKDYLAGNAPEEWLPLGTDEFHAERDVELRLGARAARLDPGTRTVTLADGATLSYDRLLLATGAEPIRLSIPGAALPHVRTLRSLADCRALIERIPTAKRAVVLGASFIGLEVAASLRARGLDVHVVAPEGRPMERVLGPQIGDFVRSLHEEHGVVFHLEDVATGISERQVALRSGGALDADLVVCGVGVRPRLELAEAAGLVLDRGVVVDEFLETSAPASSRWATSRAGRILTAARAFGSNIGTSPSGRARRPRSTCSARVKPSQPSRSSGASITTWSSIMSAMQRPGTRSTSRARSPRETACCAIKKRAASWRSPRSSATLTACAPKSRWSGC